MTNIEHLKGFRYTLCKAFPMLSALALISQVATAQDAVTASENTAALIASLKLNNGNVIEFYDFGRVALIQETGKAYTPPAYQPSESEKKGPISVVEVWKSLTPNKSVPESLVKFQKRLENPQSLPNTASNAGNDIKVEKIEEAAGYKGSEKIKDCGNGCCDYNWLATEVGPCNQGWEDYHWFLYNYGYSYSNVSDITWFDGMVCAATGTSSWKVKIGDYGHNTSIAQAHYVKWNFTTSYDLVFCLGYCGENMKSSVNTSSNTHLHTYCGAIRYDND